MVIYLDILSPLRRVRLRMQAENHDPVKHLRNVPEFTRNLIKLKSYVHESLSQYNPNSADDSDDNERIVYQDITLARYDRATEFMP